MDKDQSNLHYVPDRLGHDQRYSVDTTKIVKELDFEPSVSFDAGLKETIDWYIENQSWWRAIKK
jgi:dTDP-glucose 4,6-dehydratase